MAFATHTPPEADYDDGLMQQLRALRGLKAGIKLCVDVTGKMTPDPASRVTRMLRGDSRVHTVNALNAFTVRMMTFTLKNRGCHLAPVWQEACRDAKTALLTLQRTYEACRDGTGLAIMRCATCLQMCEDLFGGQAMGMTPAGRGVPLCVSTSPPALALPPPAVVASDPPTPGQEAPSRGRFGSDSEEDSDDEPGSSPARDTGFDVLSSPHLLGLASLGLGAQPPADDGSGSSATTTVADACDACPTSGDGGRGQGHGHGHGRGRSSLGPRGPGREAAIPSVVLRRPVVQQPAW